MSAISKKDGGNKIEIKNKRKVLDPSKIFLVWDDQSLDNKQLFIEIKGSKQKFDVEKIEDKGYMKAKGVKYHVNVKSTGYFREIEIRDKKEKENEEEVKMEQKFNQYIGVDISRTSGMQIKVDLEGLGVSIIDEEPKEIMYLSVYRIQASYENEIRIKEGLAKETEEEIDLRISHVQIDNMASIDNPILFSPDEALDKGKIMSDENYTDFIQIKLTRTLNDVDMTSSIKIDALQVVIQRMNLEVETGTLTVLITFILKILGVFNEVQQDTGAVALDNDSNTPTNRGTPIKRKEESTIELRINKEEYKDNEEDKRNLVPELKTEEPEAPSLKEIKTNKMYFGFIDLGPIKINVSFRFESKALEFDLSKGFGVLTVILTLLKTFAKVSDAPLSFKRLAIKDVFDTTNGIIDKVGKNYARQAIFQVYKILGSSDILGNPVGFVNKLGSGVYEFFAEPTKGLIQGPRGFVGGVGKGVTSLVSNIFAASFDSAGKISGSCYGILKNVSGQEYLYHRRPNN